MVEQVGLDVEIRAQLDRFERNMRAAGRLVESTTSNMDKSTKRASQAFNRLEGALDPAARAAARLERDTDKVQRALDKGAVSADRAAAVQRRLNDQYEAAVARLNGVSAAQSRASAASDRAAQVVQRTTQSYSRAGTAIQQAGFQVGDFAVQVASGQSVLRPFIQQGSQLVSVFGPAGAVIGALGAIVGAVAVSMTGADDSASDLEDTVADLAEKARDAATDFDDLRKKIDELSGAGRGLFAITAAQDLLELNERLPEIERRLDSVGKQFERVFTLPGGIDAFAEYTGIAADSLRELAEAGGRLSGASTADEIGEVADAVARFVATNRDSLGPMSDSLSSLLDQLREAGTAKQSVELLNRALDGVGQSAAGVKGATDATHRYEKALDGAYRSLEETVVETENAVLTYGKSEAVIKRVAAEQEFYNLAAEHGVTLTAEQRARLDELLGSYERATAALEDLRAAEQERVDLQREGERVTESVKTATERYGDEMDRLRRLLDAGAITQDTYRRAVAGAREELQKATGELKRMEAAAKFVEDTFDQAFDRIGSAITEAIATGRLEMAKLADVGRAVVSELVQAFAKLALVNPLKNAFGLGAGAPTLGSVFGGGGVSFNPVSLLQSIGGGLDSIGDSLAGVFRGIDSFFGIGGGVSPATTVPAVAPSGAVGEVLSGGLTAVAPASLAFAPFLGFGVAAILSSLAGKSSGPASAATFGVSGGRIGDLRIGTDNDGDPAIAQGIADSVKAATNGFLDALGGTLAAGAFRGEVGFVNGQYRASAAAPGLSPDGADFDRADATGIYGLPRDLRSFGDGAGGLRAATADSIARGLLVALNEGTLEGVTDGAANTLRIGLGNIVRGLKQGLDESGFAQFESDLQVLAVFDDLVDQYTAVSDAADGYTQVLERQRGELRKAGEAAVAGVFDPVQDVLSTASRLFDPAGPDSFQTRLRLEDALRADEVGAEAGLGNRIPPNADLDWAAVVRGIFDDTGGVRFGRGVDPVRGEIASPEHTLTDVRSLFRSDGFTIGGVEFRRANRGDEGARNEFQVFGPDGEALNRRLKTEPIGDGTDVGTAARQLVDVLVEAGADFGDAFIDEFFTPDTRDRVQEARDVAAGMVQDILDGLSLNDDAVEGLSGFGLVYETQKAQIEALRPELEKLNESFAEVGMAALDVSGTINDAVADLQRNVQADFTQSLRDVLDPEGAQVRAIRENRDRLLREADQIGLGQDSATLDLIDAVFRRQIEDIGLVLDDAGQVVRDGAAELADAMSGVAAAMESDVAAMQSEASTLRALAAQLRQARQSFRTDPAVSPLSPLDRMNSAREAFEDAFRRATEGTAEEQTEAQQEIVDLSRSYLEAGKAYYGSSLEYLAVFNDVDSKLGQIETRAQTELDVLQDQLGVLQDMLAQMRAAGGDTRNFGAKPVRNRALAALFPEFDKDFGAGEFGEFFAGRLAANDNRVRAALDIIDAVGFARGGVMSSAGPVPLRRYAAGGVADSPQIAMFGEGDRPEAYVPLADGRTIPVRIVGDGNGQSVAVMAEGFERLDGRLARLEAIIGRQVRLAQKEAARPRDREAA